MFIKKPVKENEIRILSIDGGGIRGLIPAILLQEIEKKTGKRITDLFDFFAGTSTGGILALALTKPQKGSSNQIKFTARDLVEMYSGDDGKKIFGHKNYLTLALYGNGYSSQGIEEVLNSKFGNTQLKDAMKKVFITSYETVARKATFFSSDDTRYNTMMMKNVARATSAAPYYFEPLNIQGEDNNEHTYFDGGMFANNPALCAYVEAAKHEPEILDKEHPKKVLMVSLGTGSMNNPYYFDEIKHWNPVYRGERILDFIMDGNNDTTEHLLKILLPKEDYFRFQLKFDSKATGKIDDVSNHNIDHLRKLAFNYIDNDWQDSLDELCARLKC